MAADMLGSRDALNNLADTAEKQIEKLFENNKKIKFLQPVDSKIFLIHGHGLSYVREFKEIMNKYFDISPII